MKKVQRIDNSLNEKKKESRSLTMQEKIRSFFVSPAKLFSQYEKKPSYRALFLIIGILAAILYVSKRIFDPGTVSSIIKNEVNPEYAQELINTPISPLSVILTIIGMIIAAYITVWIVSGIYYILISALNGKLTYRHTICIYSVTFIISIAGDIIITLFNGITNGALNFSVNPYVDVLLSQFSIFRIWGMLMLYIGIRTLTTLSKKKSIAVILIVFIGSTLILLGKASIGQILI